MTATNMNASAAGLRDRLIGTWALSSYVETNVETEEKSYPMGENPSGFIIYTSDGYMSAQMAAAGRAAFADNDMFGGVAEEYVASGQTYLAYSGPYTLDEQARKVTHEIVVSLFPNWAGKQQVRLITLEGNRLQLSFEEPQRSRGALRAADLVWIRADARSLADL